MAAEKTYTSLVSGSTVTGDAATWKGLDGCYIQSLDMKWESGLQKVVAMAVNSGGTALEQSNISIPDIVKGTASLSGMCPPNGTGSDLSLDDLGSAALELDVNGVKYKNTYYTQGAVQTQELGDEGQKTLILSKVFTIFGVPSDTDFPDVAWPNIS